MAKKPPPDKPDKPGKPDPPEPIGPTLARVVTSEAVTSKDASDSWVEWWDGEGNGETVTINETKDPVS